jgi:hypothetical protein
MQVLIKNLSFIVIVAIALIACNSKNKIKVRETATLKNSIIINSAQNDSTVKYAVFVPQQTENKPLPVIFLFDPHNQGQLPVETYAPLAEKYGYMLVGSMNLRNGQSGDQMQYFFNATFQDVTNRFQSIKTKYNGRFFGRSKWP